MGNKENRDLFYWYNAWKIRIGLFIGGLGAICFVALAIMVVYEARRQAEIERKNEEIRVKYWKH